MPHSSDSSDSSFSRSPPPGKQDSSDDVRKVQRREKNRIAAQKSRQRQTQKADTLHLVSTRLLTLLLRLGLCIPQQWGCETQP
ncbi:hypothetical protein U0070_007604 [Myodes glareolus]|uniref:Basic leucine zipper transcriptional factor ATF-like n=1 Tax=Myodes glareolus TaxID=447135 RepID=A0AAW0IZL7_MYOGA